MASFLISSLDTLLFKTFLYLYCVCGANFFTDEHQPLPSSGWDGTGNNSGVFFQQRLISNYQRVLIQELLVCGDFPWETSFTTNTG